MLDFGCKAIDTKDLIRCTFGLNKTELGIFLKLSKSSKAKTIQEISSLLALDRTTIQKSLKRLLDKNVVERKQKNLQSGGFVFNYAIKNREQIKHDMNKIISDWSEMAAKEINTIFE